jgi:hypothetical protein
MVPCHNLRFVNFRETGVVMLIYLCALTELQARLSADARPFTKDGTSDHHSSPVCSSGCDHDRWVRASRAWSIATRRREISVDFKLRQYPISLPFKRPSNEVMRLMGRGRKNRSATMRGYRNASEKHPYRW